MPWFVDRHWELRELDELANAPDAQFVLVFGRRRVGKTTLLLQWAQRAQQPYLYWVARRETAEATRQSFARALWRWAYPRDLAATPPRFDSWESLFGQMVRMLPEAEDLGGRPFVLIFDEFSYAVESDPSLPSHVQVLWDHQLRDKPVMLLLAGSHIGMMVDLMSSQAPLFGRFTARLPVEPLPFAALGEFFPHYPAVERVATYAVLGGVPAYLEQFDPEQGLSDNIRCHLFRRTGMFRSEPELLINDLVRETRNYEAALRAVASGAHTPSEMTEITGLTSPNLAPYLKRLVNLGLLERRVPATLPRDQRRNTTRSRYYLLDPYLRFYFRFIEPNLELIELELVDVLWQRMTGQFRAFVGGTAFEDLCREWTVTQARRGRLPFAPEIVGSHWAPDAQVDVVALSWQERAILLGECKWEVGQLGRAVVRELVGKSQRVVPGKDWQVHYIFFARAGFTASAQAEARALSAQWVDLATLDRDLREALAL